MSTKTVYLVISVEVEYNDEIDQCDVAECLGNNCNYNIELDIESVGGRLTIKDTELMDSLDYCPL